MKVNFISALDADRSGPQALILGPAADVILESLPRFGANHFVIGNDAIRVQQAARAMSVVPGGALIVLSDQAEIWPTLSTWGLTLAVGASDRARAPLSFRFFDRGGEPVLESHVAAQGRSLERARACIARWRSPWCRPSHFELRLPTAAVSSQTNAAVDGADRRAAAFERGLQRARRWGCERTVRALSAHHRRSRLEVLSLIGAPWVEAVTACPSHMPYVLHALLHAIALGGLDVRLSIGNSGATYVHRGRLPEARHTGGLLRLRDTGLDIEIDDARIAQLRVVRLRVHGQEVATLEAFDARGRLALSIAGTRDATGVQAPAWSAFLAELRRYTRPLAVAS